jgi:predicted transcriptional regulator of viral defense system
MNQIEALRRLRALAVPVVESRDAAALLNVSASNATTILRRLAHARMITHLSRGRWLVGDGIEPFALPELISAPYPAYVSLQSALFHHGLIEQIPAVIYAVTLARSRRVPTPLGLVSFHRMPPELFGGFELSPRSDAKIATQEKALFDLLYLGPARSRLFSSLPELTVPRGFRWRSLRDYAALVKSSARRAYINERIAALQAQ